MIRTRVDPGEALGRVAGLTLAPLAWAAATFRRARVFHPRGVVYRAAAVPPRDRIEGVSEVVDTLTARLVGPAIVRLSSAWWKAGREWPDVLGAAVRFRSSAQLTPEADPGDQDLLFATSPSVLTLPLAPLRTNPHDFLANVYHAMAPYELPELGRVRLVLTPAMTGARAGSRLDKLEQAIASNQAVFHLRLVSTDADRATWPLVDIELLERTELDQDQLRFSPFRAGRGLDPAGFVHGLRWAAYAASRAGHPATAR